MDTHTYRVITVDARKDLCASKLFAGAPLPWGNQISKPAETLEIDEEQATKDISNQMEKPDEPRTT